MQAAGGTGTFRCALDDKPLIPPRPRRPLRFAVAFSSRVEAGYMGQQFSEHRVQRGFPRISHMQVAASRPWERLSGVSPTAYLGQMPDVRGFCETALHNFLARHCGSLANSRRISRLQTPSFRLTFSRRGVQTTSFFDRFHGSPVGGDLPGLEPDHSRNRRVNRERVGEGL
jgi:hypothetical protein